MEIGHLDSAFLKLLINTNLYEWICSHRETLLFHLGYREIESKLIDFIPRTVWAFVEMIVGLDSSSHIDLSRVPVMARNDLGGTSTKNVYHLARCVIDNKFGPLDEESQTIKEEYKTGALK